MTFDPSLLQPLEQICGQLGIRWRSCEEQSESVKLGPVTRWRAADGSNLIRMVDLSWVGLFKDVFNIAAPAGGR